MQSQQRQQEPRNANQPEGSERGAGRGRGLSPRRSSAQTSTSPTTPRTTDSDAEAATSYNRLKGPEAAQDRYGNLRSFVLRTLYTWFTMTLLALSVWPLLVLQLDAPGTSPPDTPIDWFQLRLIAPVAVAALAAWLWRLSPVPHTALERGPALALLRRGRVWPQVLLILAGTLLLVIGAAVVEDPAGGLKLAALTLAEAAVIQVLCSGYLQSMFGMFLPTWRPAVLATGLYMLTFALRGLLSVADETTVNGTELLAAALAGAFIGLLFGGASAALRARSGSLLPGTLLLWLVFVAFGLADIYDS